MESLHAALAFLAAHPAESWAALSLLVNTVLALVSPARLVALCERSKRGAAAVAFVRRWGLDPVDLIRLGQAAIAARAARQAAASLPAGGE